jgi:hypothetical protein
MELLAIPAAIIVFLFLFRFFVSVGGHSTPRINERQPSRWDNHLKALEMDTPYEWLNHDEEYKTPLETVEGEATVRDGEIVEEYCFERQLRSGR